MDRLTDRLLANLDTLISGGVAGCALSVRMPGASEIELYAGVADTSTGTPMGPDHLFRVGSCTKTFVAAALFGLAEAGELDVSAPLSAWFPDVPYADGITLRHLVNHRSDPREARSTGLPVAEGGEMWNVDGAIGFSETAQDTTLMFHHSVGYAAGDLISSPSQLTVFLEALYGGELLSPEALIEMTGNRVPGHFVGVPIVECGAGLFVMDFDGRRLWGHGGSIPGYVTAMGHDPDSGLSIALCTNTGSGNRFRFEARGLWDVLGELLKTLS